MTPYIYAGLPLEKKSTDHLIESVAKTFDVTAEQVKSPTRERDVVDARKICAYLLNQKRKFTTTKTGQLLNRDHSSIIYLVKQAEALMEVDKDFKEKIINLKFL